ncbi:DUF881 domain-containing protein [Clostridium luticellarii]|jgi:uncharacterized protein YlxW (UPF0749 family)|uniref:Division initiation protein n=1 Tax=Clostridium luticellarii TaxID=1691940 RepID=A0A2T0BRT2_9CLOT|nr:DUF881 domain-containing protein [Clostridium luticellarii]MCI1943713.1 DUF881 domain-containing protein [Clostridium luticellarii]MCI1966974.1 DUF881 domain-containing protein [Clostridium luticellarii]MCI1994341.1 DUF881 domain-containing protein [Clostridium luticellarii]MCI2038706.1 DUF881 domain-containing protein [Clostridium luticellarii]PRR86581.1 hypothetical protein CLLU_03820 [Clostridium luticellarii]
MRKFASQISVALVCCILGFMVAYQFKVLMKQENTLNLGNQSNTDVTVTIEQYKKEKKALETKVNELQNKVKGYEDAAAGRSDSTKNLLQQLDDTRVLTGAVDVNGPGIVIYLTPNNKNLFGGTAGVDNNITDKDLVYLVNELKFAGAEAISINDIRIVSRTGIRTAGNYILINDEKISPSRKITIQAIGDKNLLYSAMSFPEVFADIKNICDVKFDKVNNITIKKYNGAYKFEYAKPIKE